jgi:protein-S-isoprenylcysteine O-methyltransferase Ste14
MRWWLARHAAAVVILPVTVTVAIPLWIVRANDVAVSLPVSPEGWMAFLGGVPLLVGGIALFISCLHRFSREGHGTLAPWDAPTELVVSGPYAYVRNPMISSVLLLLLGEGLLLRSSPHLAWAATFFVINATYIPLLEEPGLRRRFGVEYDEYRAAVPRLIPRLRPWRRPAA